MVASYIKKKSIICFAWLWCVFKWNNQLFLLGFSLESESSEHNWSSCCSLGISFIPIFIVCLVGNMFYLILILRMWLWSWNLFCCFVPANYTQVLLKYIDADQLPVHWGGSQKDPDGNLFCASKVCMHARAYSHSCACMHACILSHTDRHTHTDTRSHAHTHTHTHTHTVIWMIQKYTYKNQKLCHPHLQRFFVLESLNAYEKHTHTQLSCSWLYLGRQPKSGRTPHWNNKMPTKRWTYVKYVAGVYGRGGTRSLLLSGHDWSHGLHRGLHRPWIFSAGWHPSLQI